MAFQKMMCVLGEWHAGLSMLQSIMNVFYDGFLQPMLKCLKWGKVTKDVRNCYSQGSRLVLYVYEQLMAHPMQTFVSDKAQVLKESFSSELDASDLNYVCYVTCHARFLRVDREFTQKH